jgi:hypothetical protein
MSGKRRSQWPQRCGLRSLACWDGGLQSRPGHGYLSVLSVVYCQVEVSAWDRSLVLRSPAVCGREASIESRLLPPREKFAMRGWGGGCLRQHTIDKFQNSCTGSKVNQN